MDDAERYEFDVNGVIVFKNFLDAPTVERMNAVIDTIPEQQPFDSTMAAKKELSAANAGQAAGRRDRFSFLEADPMFLELMEHPRVLAIIREMCGDWLRLDHAYLLQAIVCTKPLYQVKNDHFYVTNTGGLGTGSRWTATGVAGRICTAVPVQTRGSISTSGTRGRCTMA